MPAEANAPPSMSDSLSAAIETVEQQETPAPADPAPVGETAQAETAAEPSPAAPSPDRPRGPDGKFLKRDGSASPAPDAASSPAQDAVPPDAGAAHAVVAPAPAAVPADTAPATWTPAAKEKWGTLDPTVKGEIARREKEIAQGMSKATEMRQFGDSVMAEFAPYAQLLAKEGATPQATIRTLMETIHTLRYGSPEHKQALFMSLADQYGIDVTKQIDPEKARLQWELDSRNVHDARMQAAQQDQLQRDVMGELETFVAAPGHEHYNAVRTVMAGMIQSGAAQSLQDAYDRACWADPTVRASLQMAENARRAQEQAKNRNALASVNGAPGAVHTGSGSDPSNLRGFLEAQFASNAGRV